MKLKPIVILISTILILGTAMPPHQPGKGPGTCIVGPPRSTVKNLRGYSIETVAILIQFTDNRADTLDNTPARYDSMLYSTDAYYGQYRMGSLNDFFRENSYDSCDVSGGIAGNRWYMSNHTYSYYDDGNYMLGTGYQLAADAVARVDATVDFHQYDYNNDGHIDGVFAIHAGPGGEDTGNIHQCWSHAIPGFNYMTNDGIVIDGATNVPEVNLVTPSLDTTLCCIAVMCHELGHVVGLPDLYDYSRYTWGIGYWGLMGYGAWGAGGNTPWSPSHAEAWCKTQVNWLNPTPITSNTFGLRIVDQETHPVAYRVWRNGAVNDTFFILENRQNKGFDTPLPGKGLLIWHIDERYGGYDDVVDLEEADGCDDLDNGWGYRPDPHYYHHELGDSGDPFPGDSGTVLFDYNSYPSSRDNWGNSTNITVRNITLKADTVICDVLINQIDVAESDPAAAEQPFSASARPNPFNNKIVIQVSGMNATGEIKLQIYDVSGRLVNDLSRNTTYDPRLTNFTWDGRDEKNEPLPGGVYFARLASKGQTEILKLLLVR